MIGVVLIMVGALGYVVGSAHEIPSPWGGMWVVTCAALVAIGLVWAVDGKR